MAGAGVIVGAAVGFMFARPTQKSIWCSQRREGCRKLLTPTGKVELEGLQKFAEFGLDTNDGGMVPNVASGDKIETRKGVTAGAADCSKPLLVSATFQ